jgi:hypothetical protein
MKLRSDMWNSDVDFDLAAFHCEVRLLKRSLRQLTEASMAYLLLEDPRRMKMVPPHVMNPVQAFERSRSRGVASEKAVLPIFNLPRACAGIVLKFALEKEDLKADTINARLRKQFPACPVPWEDLQTGLRFWKEVVRCVEVIAEPLQAEYLLNDVRAADNYLTQRTHDLGLSV